MIMKEVRKVGDPDWEGIELVVSPDDYEKYHELPYSQKDKVSRTLNREILAMRQTDVKYCPIDRGDRSYRIYCRISPSALSKWRKLPRRGRASYAYVNFIRPAIDELLETTI